MIETLKWDGNLILLDQRKLPQQIIYNTYEDTEGVYYSIKEMVVRGAPAIGVSAAYGMVIAAREIFNEEEFISQYIKKGDYLISARPTAVNLKWAVERMISCAKANITKSDRNTLISKLEDKAKEIYQKDIDTNKAIGENLLTLFNENDTILTHCNAGSLATAGYGTALSVFYVAKEKGINLKAYADETRPRLQGARLTAFELENLGVDTTLICDNMAAVVMSKGKIDAVVVGADRIAKNGDTANKIGTYGLSILAKNFNIPFYIAAPISTIDFDSKSGDDIPIEERDANEVRKINDKFITPENIGVYNPSFDVTPNENIRAIVTEKGIVYPPFEQNLEELNK